MSLLVISPCDDESWATKMKHSAKVHGLKVMCYGMHRPMGSAHGADIQGTQPIELMKTLSYDYIVAVDAPDVLFLAGEEEILEKFKSFKVGMVLSAENNCCYQVGKVVEWMSAKPGRHKYINIGCWIGERQAAIEVLQKSMDLYRNKPPEPHYGHNLDSPAAWISYGLVDGTIGNCDLDRDQVLFQSMLSWSANDVEVRDGRIYNTFTKTWPIALHYNGSGSNRTAYNEMYERLFGFGINVSDAWVRKS